MREIRAGETTEENNANKFESICIRGISGRDAMDAVESGEILQDSLIATLVTVPPSLARTAVVPLLLDDGTIMLGCKRGSSKEAVRGNEVGERHGEGDIGGVIVGFTPCLKESSGVGCDCGVEEGGSTSYNYIEEWFRERGIGKEPRFHEKFGYSQQSFTKIWSGTCIISDMVLSPVSGALVISATGLGSKREFGEIYPPAISIAIDTDKPILPVHFGHADCVCVGFADSGIGGSNSPKNARTTTRFDVNHGNIYFLTNSGKLCALFDYNSRSARVLRTKRAALLPMPETPRLFEGSATESGGEAEEGEGEEDAESSMDDSAHEELFNGLSEALASDTNDREIAARRAMTDPSLSKDGPVNVKVVVRCRPLLSKEKKEQIPSCIQTTKTDCTLDGKYLPLKTSKTYTMDRVFGSEASQKDVFVEVVSPIVMRVLDGYKCTVFAYGQTGSGKTYTMEGEAHTRGAEASGLIPRAVHGLFDELNADKTCKYTICASHMEIYLEQPYDLLASDNVGGRWKAGTHMNQKLTIVEKIDGSGGIEIQGLSNVQVNKPSDIFKIMHRTKQNRHSAETHCNRASSRSHAIFTLNVTLRKKTSLGEVTKRGRLNLVDLSGSECIKRSGVSGIHAVEAATIGKSLLSLGRVIRSLTGKEKHVPYRESKLTRILSDSLGGSSFTALILAVTPNSKMIGESMSTLGYGMLARGVTNKPKSDVSLKKKKKKRKVKKMLKRTVSKKVLIDGKEVSGGGARGYLTGDTVWFTAAHGSWFTAAHGSWFTAAHGSGSNTMTSMICSRRPKSRSRK